LPEKNWCCALRQSAPGHRPCKIAPGRRSHGLGGSRAAVAGDLQAFSDPRFKLFTDISEDTAKLFLSAPVIARSRGLKHGGAASRTHFHSGGEMELLTTVGEQIGCLVALAQSDLKALDTAHVLDLVMSPARRG
jgi:signal transduction protein with GAF and PtsI domain